MRQFISVITLCMAILTLAFQGQAAVLTVTNTSDSGPGSLRDQLAVAVAGDTLDFSVIGTIVLTSGELAIGVDVLIEGPGADVLSIDAQGSSRVFSVGFSANPVIRGLTVMGGSGLIGGGIWVQGDLTMEDCTIRDNTATGPGGGINTTGNLTLNRCALIDNHANSFGGAVVNNFSAISSFTNCTFSGNTAGVDGGAIYANGNLTLSYCTITENDAADEAGGFYNNTAGMFCLGNIISKNSAANGGQDYFQNVGTTTSLGYNFIGIADDAGCAFCFIQVGDTTGTLAGPISASLGPLADNGGPTLSHAPNAGSPVIDTGDPASSLTTDQRGMPRPVGGTVDKGSVEFQGGCPVPTGQHSIPGSGTVTLSWNPVSGSIGYQVQGRPAGSSAGGKFITTATSKTVGGLSPSTTYEWRIRANCGLDISPWSGFESFTTLP